MSPTTSKHSLAIQPKIPQPETSPNSDTFTRPAHLLTCFILFHILLLTLVPTILSTAPPIDVVEGWTWAPHWPIGTYKHPAGPAWSIEIMHWIVPGYFFGPYLLSQISVALTYAFVYLIGRQFMEPVPALAGTLLLSGSLYLTYLSTEFNHNVLQLPFWSAIIFSFACITRTPARTSTWLVLGALVGAGMYAKYSVAIIGFVVTSASLFFPRVRSQFLSPRPYLAVTLAIAIFLPHAFWLIDNDFPPLKYVADRSKSTGSAWQPLAFLFAQIVNQIPILALLVYIGRPALRATDFVEVDTKAFLRIFTLGPCLLLVAGALISGKHLIPMWGLPMSTTIGLWIVAETGWCWEIGMLRRLSCGAVAVVILPMVVFSGERIWSVSHKPKREFWPMLELANKANGVWSAEVSAPLSYVGGSLWLSGLVSLGLPQKPEVAVGNELEKSPWIAPRDIIQKGALYMTDIADAPLPAYCAVHGQAHKIQLYNRDIPPAFATVCYPNPVITSD